MRSKRLSLGLAAVLAMFVAATLMRATRAAAQTAVILHNFNNNGTDGINPWGGLVFDSADNLYGTTLTGGADISGTAFELVRQAGGGFAERILHNFGSTASDGTFPNGNLIFDASGHLYGVTSAGGAHDEGAVFELARGSGGAWGERVVYSFKSTGKDGNIPPAGLVFDSAGNLYGATELGGASGDGTVYELSQNSGGGWSEKILLNFTGTNGDRPFGSLIFDSAGNLYGTTLQGGTFNDGVVFQLAPSSGGTWTETVLYNFGSVANDATRPTSNLIFDSGGNLYGTAVAGGTFGGGAVFELSPSGGGWSEAVLHSFPNFNGVDGTGPMGGLIFDASGNLYGTTSQGGSGPCVYFAIVGGCGTIFELTPGSGGTWTESLVYSFDFPSNENDAVPGPYAGLVLDSSGNFFGTTYGGGTNADGTAFGFKP
jgi:uncharacterized repeat protein (TIGR03803 family)